MKASPRTQLSWKIEGWLNCVAIYSRPAEGYLEAVAFDEAIWRGRRPTESLCARIDSKAMTDQYAGDLDL